MNRSRFNSVALNAAPRDVAVRVLVDAIAYASVAVKPRAVRVAVVGALASADVQARVAGLVGVAAQVTARAVAAGAGYVVARAVLALQGRAEMVVRTPAVRSLVHATAGAVIALSAGTVRRSQHQAVARASADIAPRALVRGMAAGLARAEAVALLRRLRTAPVVVLGEAQIYVQGGVVKRVQFDEPAVDAQTFMVAFTDNVFYVR